MSHRLFRSHLLHCGHTNHVQVPNLGRHFANSSEHSQPPHKHDASNPLNCTHPWGPGSISPTGSGPTNVILPPTFCVSASLLNADPNKLSGRSTLLKSSRLAGSKPLQVFSSHLNPTECRLTAFASAPALPRGVHIPGQEFLGQWLHHPPHSRTGFLTVKLLQHRQHGRGDQSFPNEDAMGFN